MDITNEEFPTNDRLLTLALELMKRKAFAVCPTGLNWDMEKDGFQYFVCVNV